MDIFSIDFLFQVFLACLLFSILLPVIGFQIVKRGIVFIDLALAQVASLGVAVSTYFEGTTTYFPILFTLVGAIILFLAGFKKETYLQEGIIGTFYAISTAATILIMSKSPCGEGNISHMLFGDLLSVSWSEIINISVVFLIVFILFIVFWEKFVTKQDDTISFTNIKDHLVWDLLFYLLLAITISLSIKVSGVLVVFSFLIIPVITSLILFKSIRYDLISGFLISILSSILGIKASYTIDFPLGASIVGCLGIFFLFILIYSALKHFIVPNKDTNKDSN